MRRLCAFLIVFTAQAVTAQAAEYQLKATPATVVWGHYSAAAKPVLSRRFHPAASHAGLSAWADHG